MTESPDARRARWRRLMTSTRGRVEVVALSLVLILCGAVGFVVVPAVADDEKLAGKAVPAGDVPAIVAAALSCPSLNPPRLAAQIMSISGFSDAGPNGNVAGLDAAAWSKWRPSTDARATDRAAAILALGHRTCEIVGQLRSGGLAGDLWPAAVAATRTSVGEVVQAKGVPAAQKKHVDTVVAYARWYADQPEFRVAGDPVDGLPVGSPAAAMPVPDDLVAFVQAAGRICPAITPTRVAAQLRALSNFNVNLRSADGRQGIAQFTPQLWSTYQARKDASMWDPEEAIPAMGVAMCRLNAELSGLGGESYVLALGAYQWGANVIRQAGGLPRTTVSQLADKVLGKLPEYEKDSRLAAPGGSPKPSSSPSAGTPSSSASAGAPSSSPSAGAPSAFPTAPPPGDQEVEPPTVPADQPLYEIGKTYMFFNVHSNNVLEISNRGGQDSGSPVSVWARNGGKNQLWRLGKTGQWVTITNVQTGLALAVENESKDRDAKLVLETPYYDHQDQHWTIMETGNGEVVLKNRHSGRVADLAGDDWGPPFADGTWDGANVYQYDYQDYARDQHWKILKP